MNVDKFMADTYFEISMEMRAEHTRVTTGLIRMAYGFYRDIEDVEGIRKCKAVLRDDLSPGLQNRIIETAFQKQDPIREALKKEERYKILLESEEGVKELKIEVKSDLRKSIANLTNILKNL